MRQEALQLALILCKYASVPESQARRVIVDSVVFDSTWREAARRTHPDTNGQGDAKDFRHVISARDRLKELKKWQ